jgi:adenylate cyclase
MKDFIRELRQRNVVKVAIAYLVVSWLVLQFADIAFPAMGLPEWTITLALGLLGIGFPVALVLAWIFDITPEGVQRTDDAAPEQQPETVESSTTSTQSIAVLPFPDMSAEKDQDHFCDGLTEELLNVLTRIPGLRVASRTSCFAFKGREPDLAAVGEKLSVAHVLEGSVRKAGNKVRITAQLIEVATDSHLWSETYDRELDDIFAIQDDIANRILEVLKLKLGPEKLPEATTHSAKAYEYFLRGRGYAMTNSDQDIDRAIEMFQKAGAADPRFVRAWIGLAEISSMKALFMSGGGDSCTIANDAGEKAMQLAPDRAGSFLARGYAHLASQRFPEAERDFLKAIELDPLLVRAYHYLGRAAQHQGKTDCALEYFEKAVELDPDDYESPLLVISNYHKAGDDEGAERAARIGVERAERHLEDYPDNPRPYYLGAAGLITLGERDRALEWAEHALALAPEDSSTRYNLACNYAMLGQTGKALDCLENSISSHSWIENDPELDSLRSHPRYKAIIESLKAQE